MVLEFMKHYRVISLDFQAFSHENEWSLSNFELNSAGTFLSVAGGINPGPPRQNTRTTM